MFAAEDKDTKLAVIGESKTGYYHDHVDLRVTTSSGADYKITCMPRQQYELEQFLLELDIPKEKMERLCELIEEHGIQKSRDGYDDARETYESY